MTNTRGLRIFRFPGALGSGGVSEPPGRDEVDLSSWELHEGCQEGPQYKTNESGFYPPERHVGPHNKVI